ncbi:IS1167 transposase [Streptococcus pneumoniae]|nr:IS1167 transposase [Streptococcus pneumoniae]
MDKMKPVFQALNKELIQENLTLTIICVGGYVLEYHGLRATQDVDAFMALLLDIKDPNIQILDIINKDTHKEIIAKLDYDAPSCPECGNQLKKYDFQKPSTPIIHPKSKNHPESLP